MTSRALEHQEHEVMEMVRAAFEEVFPGIDFWRWRRDASALVRAKRWANGDCELDAREASDCLEQALRAQGLWRENG